MNKNENWDGGYGSPYQVPAQASGVAGTARTTSENGPFDEQFDSVIRAAQAAAAGANRRPSPQTQDFAGGSADTWWRGPGNRGGEAARNQQGQGFGVSGPMGGRLLQQALSGSDSSGRVVMQPNNPGPRFSCATGPRPPFFNRALFEPQPSVVKTPIRTRHHVRPDLSPKEPFNLSKLNMPTPKEIVVSERCICHREVKLLMCSFCGYRSDKLRKQIVCPEHPKYQFYMDLKACPNKECKANIDALIELLK